MNNNTENNNKQQETGNEASRNNQPQKTVKRTFAKRWTFPVIYLAASVLIVGLMYAKSKDASPYEIDKTKNNAAPHEQQMGPTLPDQAATPTSSTPEMTWPVGQDGGDASISMAFFHDSDSQDQQAKEVVAYNNSFTPHEGVDIGLKNDAPFTVIAAAKGTVTNVTLDPLMGNVVEIDHGNGYTSYYASLSEVDVKKGDNVLLGQPIAKSGNNRFETSEKNHLHFELRKAGVSVDPNTVLPKKPVGDDATTTSGSSISTPASTDSSKATSEDNGSAATSSSDAKSDDAKSNDASQDKDASSTAPAEKSDDANASDSSSGSTDTH
jgi:stage II sporulation protein Q